MLVMAYLPIPYPGGAKKIDVVGMTLFNSMHGEEEV
jgi:hypothetical protein